MPFKAPPEIERSHILEAIGQYRSSRRDRFRSPNRYDLLHEGERYPSEAIIGIAASISEGRDSTQEEGHGGDPAVRFLIAQGFEIATKIMKVGSLDAEFSVGQGRRGYFVLIESRGEDRNPDYLPALELILGSLADEGLALLNALVESATTIHLDELQRSISPLEHRYPIALANVSDIAKLRQDITKSSARVARRPNAKGPGNPTRRMRLELGGVPHGNLYDFAARISGADGTAGGYPAPFVFKASAPNEDPSPSLRAPVSSTVAAQVHKELKSALYSELVSKLGADNVASEHKTPSGCPADLVVRIAGGFSIYEIKTDQSPRVCVRQAVGQLLEYGHWSKDFQPQELWIVGPSPLDPDTEKYLTGLRETFRLPLAYRYQERPAGSSAVDASSAI